MTSFIYVHLFKLCRKVHFDKLSFFPDRALGSYFGSQFEVHRQQLVPVHVNETAISGAWIA